MGLYSGQSGSGGGLYSGGGNYSGPSAPTKKKSGGGGGFLHDVGHALNRGALDLKDAAVNLPGGLYTMGKTEANDLAAIIEGAPRSDPRRQAANKLGLGIVHQTAQDFRHPLRHPGYTALDLLTLGGGGAESAARLGRFSETGRVAALLEHAPPGERVFRLNGGEARGIYSRSALARRAQKSADTIRHRHPELPLGRRLASRIGQERVQAQRVRETIAARPAHELLASAKGLKKGQRLALRIVAEEVPLGARLQDARALLADASGREKRLLGEHVKLLQRAGQYVHDVQAHDGRFVPRFKPEQEKLVDVYEKALRATGGRERDLIESGLLDASTAKERRSVPGQQIQERLTGGEIVRSPSGAAALRMSGTSSSYALEREVTQHETILRGERRKLATLERRLVKPPPTGRARPRPKLKARVEKQRQAVREWEQALAGARTRRDTEGPQMVPAFQNREGFYVNYKTGKVPGAVYRAGGTRGGIPRADSTLTHKNTGAALATGAVNPNTPRVVAESGLAANKLLSLWQQRHELGKFATPLPRSERDIPLRPIWLKNKPWMAPVRDALSGVDYSADDPALRGKLAEVARAVFLHEQKDSLRAKALAEGPVKDVMWIDPRLLGGADKPRPLVGIASHPGAAKTLSGVDAVNNATKTALIYLKLAYATPNLLGNIALNLVQQGVFFPANLAKTARFASRLGRDDWALLNELMGEGVARSIAHNPGGPGRVSRVLSGAATKLSGGWGKVVDKRFRETAFLHEARRAGYASPEKLHRLLADPALEHKLIEVTRRAQAAIIDYGRLGPVEQDLIRRIVFLYPWVKGSTMYAGHFLAEHPIQAGAAGQVGALGKRQSDTELGALPSWAEGLIRTGGQGNNIRVSNPAAAAILQTPAGVLETAREMVAGPHRPAYDLASQLSPVAAALVAELARKDSFSGYNYKPSDSSLKILEDQFFGGLPQKALYQRLRHPKPGTYSYSKRDALLQFLLGGISPRSADLAKLHAKARAEQTGR